MINEKFEDESNVIEYKKTLPRESDKWLKTVVSFSYTSGGKLIIDIEDSTLNVFGITEVRLSVSAILEIHKILIGQDKDYAGVFRK